MASSEIRDDRSERPRNGAPPDPATSEAAEASTSEHRSERRFASSRVLGAGERERVLREVREVDFPVSMRGYERVAVERYVERVTRLITELEMSSSPEAAVRHALDEVSEETRDILQHAHQTADEITARSRSRADDRLEQAEAEALTRLEGAQREALEIRQAAQEEARGLTQAAAGDAATVRETAQREADALRDRAQQEIAELREAADRDVHQLRAAAQRETDELRDNVRRETDAMREAAETRARDLARSAAAIWRERRRLIDDMQAVGDQLVAIGETEGKRFPRPVEDPAMGAESGLGSGSEEAGSSVTGEPAPAGPLPG
jgi:vacuolar-type H+-ATPase subunit E/Vma4